VPAERVYPLISSGRAHTQWWAADVTDIDSSGVVDLGFFDRATLYRLKPVPLAGPMEAEWLCETGKEWCGTKLIFELTEKDGHTLVRFTHADGEVETDYFASSTTTWGELMFRLKGAAEGKNPGPLFSHTGLAY